MVRHLMGKDANSSLFKGYYLYNFPFQVLVYSGKEWLVCFYCHTATGEPASHTVWGLKPTIMIGLVELKERWFEQGFNHTRN